MEDRGSRRLLDVRGRTRRLLRAQFNASGCEQEQRRTKQWRQAI